MKKMLVLALFAAAASVASASTLYWQLSEDSTDAAWSDDYRYATLYYGDGQSNVGEWNTKAMTVSLADVDTAFAFDTDVDLSTKYFFVELTKSQENTAEARLGGEGYATALVQGSDLPFYSGGMATPSVYTGFDSFSSDIVPEPTSALLVLVGALALGLKRKRELV